jgi:hypothetical protein
VSPLGASNGDILDLRLGLSWGALTANFPAPASDQGFFRDEEANAFFTTAENLAQLQLNEASSQGAGFDRSIGRFLGSNIIGGPTG